MGAGMGRLTLAVVAALTLTFPVGASARGGGLGIVWTVTQSPFRIIVLDHGRPILRESVAARLRYQLAATGEQHYLTNATAAQGDVYTVATDEPGRTATVTISRRPNGVRISTVLSPASGVEQVYDAFDTSAGEHFMGGG